MTLGIGRVSPEIFSVFCFSRSFRGDFFDYFGEFSGVFVI